MKPLSDCRVLLVDDAKANLDILVEALKGDHKLSLALNGETALQIAARTPPDLVLLDILMPGMDGYEVCRRLRQMPETAEVPIMFLSSLEEVQNKTRGFEAGANDYVTKPFDMPEVKARVRSLLKAKAYNDAVKEQIASELRIAREIQMGILPQDFTEFEKAYHVRFGALLHPAREVGGDLYGVCAATPHKLVFFIGDVSGKGIPASMFMVRVSSLARLLARQFVDPEQILARLNDELAVDNPSGMFVTFLCAVFEPATGRLSLANAGHCRPVLLRPGQAPRWAVKNLGTALGFEPGLVFERTNLDLRPGDSLLLYTDGITEAFNPEEECFGNERLLAELEPLATATAPAVAHHLFRRIRAFAATAPQSDDIAILAVTVSDPNGPDGETLELELRATPEEVMRAVETLQQTAAGWRLGERETFALALALEECASNIVNHGLERDGGRSFHLRIHRAADRVTLELRDGGPAFDPTQVAARQPGPEDAHRAPGGWGVQLVRHYMDDITYRREDGENVLRLVRKTGARSTAK